jgi:hypothetical protein
MKEALRSEIEKTAEQRGVSMNAEITSRLELSFASEKRTYDIVKRATTSILNAFGVSDPGALRVLDVFIDVFLKSHGHDFLSQATRRAEFADTINKILRTFACDYDNRNEAMKKVGSLDDVPYGEELLHDVIAAFDTEEDIRDRAMYEPGEEEAQMLMYDFARDK